MMFKEYLVENLNDKQYQSKVKVIAKQLKKEYGNTPSEAAIKTHVQMVLDRDKKMADYVKSYGRLEFIEDIREYL